MFHLYVTLQHINIVMYIIHSGCVANDDMDTTRNPARPKGMTYFDTGPGHSRAIDMNIAGG